MARRPLRARLLPRLIAATRILPRRGVLASRPLIAAAIGRVPGWRERVRRNMEAALGGEPEPASVTAYFRHLADLAAYSALIYRSGLEGAGLEKEWGRRPGGLEAYQQALEGGRGVLMVCPHLVGHEIMAGTSTRDLPITVLVRESPDPGYEAMKRRWYGSLGLEVVHRPRRGSSLQGLVEITSALRVLRKNRVLAITPDLIQKPGSGVPVRLFGRTAELPAGAFFLAARTGAPLMPTFFHREADRYLLWTHPPLEPAASQDRHTAVAELAQRWTDHFEAFVREHPDMWQFWLDKRWSRWLEVEGR